MEQLMLNTNEFQQTDVERYASEIIDTLGSADRGYDLSQIIVEDRSPQKSEAYQALIICGAVSLYVKGKKTKYVYFSPQFTKILKNNGWNLDEGNDRWARLSVDTFPGFRMMGNALISLYESCLYSSSGRFACCADYEKCSDVGKCIKSDIMFAGKCAYRQNLMQGKIFYGKNRNI